MSTAPSPPSSLCCRQGEGIDKVYSGVPLPGNAENLGAVMKQFEREQRRDDLERRQSYAPLCVVDTRSATIRCLGWVEDGGNRITREHVRKYDRASPRSPRTKEEVFAELDALLLQGVEGGGDDPDGCLRALSAQAPQRVCSVTFSFGDIVWKCKTCQVGDETCVVCQACYQAGDHAGHDVAF